eukprot:g991.t1
MVGRSRHPCWERNDQAPIFGRQKRAGATSWWRKHGARETQYAPQTDAMHNMHLVHSIERSGERAKSVHWRKRPAFGSATAKFQLPASAVGEGAELPSRESLSPQHVLGARGSSFARQTRQGRTEWWRPGGARAGPEHPVQCLETGQEDVHLAQHDDPSRASLGWALQSRIAAKERKIRRFPEAAITKDMVETPCPTRYQASVPAPSTAPDTAAPTASLSPSNSSRVRSPEHFTGPDRFLYDTPSAKNLTSKVGFLSAEAAEAESQRHSAATNFTFPRSTSPDRRKIPDVRIVPRRRKQASQSKNMLRCTKSRRRLSFVKSDLKPDSAFGWMMDLPDADVRIRRLQAKAAKDDDDDANSANHGGPADLRGALRARTKMSPLSQPKASIAELSAELRSQVEAIEADNVPRKCVVRVPKRRPKSAFMSSDRISVIVRVCNGAVASFRLGLLDTVGVIRNCVQKRWGFPHECQELTLNGRMLRSEDDNATLADLKASLGIVNNSVIMCNPCI